MKSLLLCVLFAASAVPATAQHCLSNMSFQPRSRVDEFVDIGDGRYRLEGPILEPEMRVTFRSFQLTHARLNIVGMEVREHTSDQCFDALAGVTLTTVPLQPLRAPEPLTTVTLGMYDSQKAYVKAMKKAGIELGAAYYDTDKTVEAVNVSRQPSQVTVAVVTPRDLGFSEDVMRADFYAQAQAHGLRLAPPEAALALRLAWRNQPRDEVIWVATEGIRPPAYAWHKNGTASPRIFGLDAAGNGALFLVSDNAYEDAQWSYVSVDHKYAFAVDTK